MKIKSYSVVTADRVLTVLAMDEEIWKQKSIPELIDLIKKRKHDKQTYDDYPNLYRYVQEQQLKMQKEGNWNKPIFNPFTKKYGTEDKPDEKKETKKEEKEKKEKVVGVPEEVRKKGIHHFIGRIAGTAYNRVKDTIGKEISDAGSTAHALNKVLHNEELTDSEKKTSRKILHHIGVAVAATLATAGAIAFLGPLALVAVDSYLDYRQQTGQNYSDNESENTEGEDDEQDDKQKSTQEVLEEKEAQEEEKKGMKIKVGDDGTVVLADGSVVKMTKDQIDDFIKNMTPDQLREKFGDSLTDPKNEATKEDKKTHKPKKKGSKEKKEDKKDVQTEETPEPEKKEAKASEETPDPLKSFITDYVTWLTEQDPAKLKADLEKRKSKQNPYKKDKEQ